MSKNRIRNIDEIDTVITVPPIVTLPPRIEKLYRLAKEGGIGNLRVEEITIQGFQVIGRKFVTERDAKPYAMSKILDLIEERVRRDYL